MSGEVENYDGKYRSVCDGFDFIKHRSLISGLCRSYFSTYASFTVFPTESTQTSPEVTISGPLGPPMTASVAPRQPQHYYPRQPPMTPLQPGQAIPQLSHR